jgi:hypothetical protein
MFTRVKTGAACAVAVAAAAAAVTTPALTAAGPAKAEARMCAVDTVVYKTPEKGRLVWIPTNVYDMWQDGGTQTRSFSDGQSTATSKGSSHTIGGSGGVDVKLVKVSAKYDYTWSRNTTNTVSWTKGYSYSFNLPAGETSRTRLYRKGFRFPVKQIVTYTNNCDTKIFWHRAIVPTAATKLANYKWAVELYRDRGKLKY